MIIRNDCPLCATDGGRVVWRDGGCRVVIAQDAGPYVVCRVVLADHVSEMTDLSPEARDRLMQVVFAAEAAVRTLVRPDKINLASLGNQVPHLHWHVIARFRTDPQFPDPIWAPPRRPGSARPALDPQGLAVELARRLGPGEDA